MAAKKAATKSRSSKSNKNKNNLKWWYVLPVIAIVAVAGYAIVRFSEAGTQSGRLSGGTTVDKGNGNTAMKVGNKPVQGTWSPVARGRGTTFCATMFMSNGDGKGAATLSLWQGTSKLQAQDTPSFRGTGTRCITATTLDNFRIAGRNATLKVTRSNGYVSVYNMEVR